jgi:hypothetical protein
LNPSWCIFKLFRYPGKLMPCQSLPMTGAAVGRTGFASGTDDER